MDDIAKNHHATRRWDQVITAIRQAMVGGRVHPARTVVLVPYAQLIAVARAAWVRSAEAQGVDSGFVPRFETTMNWTHSLGGFVPGGDDLRMDAARDVLTATSLLERAGMADSHGALAGRLMASAWSLARHAAAVPPAQRSHWGARLALALQTQPLAPVLETEAGLGYVALAWAANSAYRTDSLFSARADLLVLLQGLQPEPLYAALSRLWGERALELRLDAAGAADEAVAAGEAALHQALDLEDEAGRAAACVLAHLAQGRTPVALVAQDRIVTRRVRAQLGERGVAVRDETGWTLSTTRAAALVLGLLRAAAWDASTDTVLDWAKSAPAFNAEALAQLEATLRRGGERDWHRLLALDAVSLSVNAMRAAFAPARPLGEWLDALRSALQQAGQWQGLVSDSAGQAVLDALRLHPGAAQEFADFPRRWSLGTFKAWASQALEAGSFQPPHPARAQVVILPSSQLLGRAMGAVVFPGCDELRLPASPEPPGMWSAPQRALLGLPPREELGAIHRATWDYALRSPYTDLLWRGSEGGEQLLPSPLVQERLLHAAPLAPDPRVLRWLASVPGCMPQPRGDALPLRRLSASAYEDLRRCPYRFFALRQLGLQESDELDTALGKRDFGNWLHRLLKHFHEALLAAPATDPQARLLRLDAAAAQATQDLGLAQNEFLPFAASWPKVRAAYLQWLGEHEATGARFVQAEAWKEMPLGALTLVGRIDRVDLLADGTALVIDYKTEPRGKTSERLKNPGEDTQLAFYGALLADDTLAAQYLNISESDSTRAYPQSGIVELRDQLLQSIQEDLQRIEHGARLPALGQGQACEYCAARGLCRKDFWETGEAAVASVAHA